MRAHSPNMRVLLPSLGFLLLVACGEKGEASKPLVVDPWARPATVEIGDDGSPTPANSAVYLTVRNPGPASEVLLGGATPAAGAVELHESLLEGDVMRMREVEGLEVPGGEEAELRPGGLHLMLLGLRQSLAVGDTLTLTLFFQGADSLEISVPVRTMGGG
jgi:copper(I)-binding protein